MPEKASLEKRKDEALEKAEQAEDIAKAYEKLNRKEYSVEIPRKGNLISTLKHTIRVVRESGKSKEIEEQVKKAEQQLHEAEKDLIKATLVPLSAMDLLVVQSHVAEASLRGEEASFDVDVRLFMLVKSEQCATVYLALRKNDDLRTRYFAKQEDVVLLDEMTLRAIVLKYKEAFVLEEDERKNS